MKQIALAIMGILLISAIVVLTVNAITGQAVKDLSKSNYQPCAKVKCKVGSAYHEIINGKNYCFCQKSGYKFQMEQGKEN